MTVDTNAQEHKPRETIRLWPEQRRTRLRYLPGLDGLRAIAVIAVLLFHAGLPAPGGFLGVETFFVLSGFLITALLWGEWRDTGRVNLGAFWLRRARRLLPALFALLAVVVLYTLIALPWQASEVGGDVLAAIAYVMNWRLILGEQPYFDPMVRPPLLQHLWSLAVEEQFYLLWPLLFAIGIRLFRTTGLLIITIATALASAALMALLFQPGVDPSRIYYGTDTRAAGLLLGAALALIWRPNHPPAPLNSTVGRALDIAGIAALAGLVATYWLMSSRSAFLYRGGFLLVTLCTLVVIMAVTHPRTRLLTRGLGCWPLREIGLRSYGIYLWHWPVFQLTRPFLDVPLDGVPLLLLRLVIVAVLVELSYRLVELPIRRGAIERLWWSLRERYGPRAIDAAVARLRWLAVPLVGALLFAGVASLARWETPRIAAQPSAPVAGGGNSADPEATAPAKRLVWSSTPITPTQAAQPTPTAAAPEPQATSGAASVSQEPARSDGAPLGTEPTSAPPTPTPAATATPATPKPLDPELIAKLQHLLDDTVDDGFVPGAVLSVSIPGYESWSGASGYADRRARIAMEPDTRMHISSITKMFTAVVVLQLVEEGKIKLDAPIGAYLPGIIPLDDATTVRHLLQQMSGIFDYLEDSRFFVGAYRNPQRTYTPAEIVDMVDHFGAEFEPGTAWKYSSTNYVILGMLVEQVTGRMMAEEMRQRIFAPLDLRGTYFAPYEKVQGNKARGHIDSTAGVDVSMTFVYSTGNIVSTVSDLRAFADALFNHRLLKPETLAAMTTLKVTGGAYEMPELEYGLGVMGARLNVGPNLDGEPRPDSLSVVLGHIGGIAGFRSALWWAPESNITIALSMNQADLDPNFLARDVLDVILTSQGR